MIRINTNYIDRFKCNHTEFLYPISKGVYLAFDRDTLDYIGIEMYYCLTSRSIEKIADEMLNKLLAKGILETTL